MRCMDRKLSVLEHGATGARHTVRWKRSAGPHHEPSCMAARIELSLVDQTVKKLPAMQETHVWSLGQEDSPWRREWQPTPVFLPGESHGQRSLVGYSPWGCKDSDTTEGLTLSLSAGNWESVKDFKQESDIIRFLFQRDSSDITSSPIGGK